MILSRLRRATAEGLIIAAAGLGVAFSANFLSPRGISLRRNYFPAATPAAPASKPAARIATDREERFARRGLNLIAHDRAVELFRDPRFAEGRIAFIDARDDRHFREGHIPGAVQFDHYRMEQHVANVLAACALAEQIVVYCNGGNCEDSELAAIDLLEFGIPSSKLAVYSGGIDEWRRHGLPLETGPRGSGLLLKP